MAFENVALPELEEDLQSDFKHGLTSEEAKERLLANGKNELPEKKRESLIKTFLRQLFDPMIYILLGAIVINIIFLIMDLSSNEHVRLVEDIAEIGIILAVILINAIIGTIQERKAAMALDALKKMAAPKAFVKRDGAIIEVFASELVIGDIVVLEEGNIIPADVRLIEAINLKCDESSLTGESVPVNKDATLVFSQAVGTGDRLNCAYMSSIVSYGRGEGVVIGTALNTEIGKIAKLLSNEKEAPTPLQKKLKGLSKFLGILAVIIVVLILGVMGLARNNWSGDWSLFGYNFGEAVKTSITLAVAAIPEGLVAVVTIVLAIGMQRMAKVNTIVRKLPSVETLGAVSTICSDKTGTLTQNKMSVVSLYSNDQVKETTSINIKEEYELVRGFALCSNARIEGNLYGDPTEIALVQLALDHGYPKSTLEAELPRIEEMPFDSVRKMMSTLHRDGDKDLMFTKGALDQVLKCVTKISINGQVRNINKDDINRIEMAAHAMSEKALRVLALAYKETKKISEDNLIFLGFVGMIDPPRPEAYPAIIQLKEAGITTIMITGDHVDTAYAIASDLKIVDRREHCYTGEQIDQMSPEELQVVVQTARVFARVSPTNKTEIVGALKANNQIVAMTGDGVNDAPSLKAADIGIAMGITGTDVAKGAADMVLKDDNFASIEKAVEEGRGIYANIKKAVIFLLSSNIAEVISMFLAICVGLGTPLSPIHVLWVNLATDSLPAIALGMDSTSRDLMKEKPRKENESLFAKGGMKRILVYGALISLLTLASYVLTVFATGGTFDLAQGAIISADIGADTEHIGIMAQTVAFNVLAMSQLFHMFGISSGRRSFFKTIKSKNRIMWIAFGVGFALQLAVSLIPGVNMVFGTDGLYDHWWLWFVILGFAIIPLLLHEVVVLFSYIRQRSKTKRVQGQK